MKKAEQRLIVTLDDMKSHMKGLRELHAANQASIYMPLSSWERKLLTLHQARLLYRQYILQIVVPPLFVTVHLFLLQVRCRLPNLAQKPLKGSVP